MTRPALRKRLIGTPSHLEFPYPIHYADSEKKLGSGAKLLKKLEPASGIEPPTCDLRKPGQQESPPSQSPAESKESEEESGD